MTDPSLADLVVYQAKDPQQAISAALAAVQSYCGWHIAPSATATVSVWSSDGCSVFLPTMNLTAVTTVTQDAVVLGSTTYTFESYGVIRRTSGNAFGTSTRVTVAFTHGYATMPKDAADVVLALAQRSISDTRGMVSKTIGPFSENYGPQLGQAEKDRLAPYCLSTGFA